MGDTMVLPMSYRFPRREDVERSNNTRMRTLTTVSLDFPAGHGGKLWGSEQGEKLLANFMAPSKLTLKLGAQVRQLPRISMLIGSQLILRRR